MARLNGFTKQQLLDIYNTMVLARELDNRMLTLIKQGKGFFHMGCSGHESAQIAAALTINEEQVNNLLDGIRVVIKKL